MGVFSVERAGRKSPKGLRRCDWEEQLGKTWAEDGIQVAACGALAFRTWKFQEIAGTCLSHEEQKATIPRGYKRTLTHGGCFFWYAF